MIYLDFVFVVNLLIHNLILYSVFKVHPLDWSKSKWWRIRGSNPWPPACKAGALPAELIPQMLVFFGPDCVALSRCGTQIRKYVPFLALSAPCQTRKILRIPVCFFCLFQTRTLFTVFLKNSHSAETFVSLERRWSSRSFSNGYLVTTSPQSLVLP